MNNFEARGKLTKVDKVAKIAYGWAYVSEEKGNAVEDHSGDMWSIEDVEKTAHNFVCECRTSKEMHSGTQKGELVASIVFTKAIQEALGIDLGKQGWFVGIRIDDEELLEKVEKGELPMFSIGGTAIREEI